MDSLIQLGVFAAEVLLVVIAIIVILVIFFGLLLKNQHKPELEVENLNKTFDSMAELIKSQTLDKKNLKKLNKDKKKEKKKDKKKNELEDKNKIFVVKFSGDIKASAVSSLREEISAILGVAKGNDEVVVCLESQGGMVHSYGFAASQLQRIKEHGIPLTICVDKVAASGGYMMACVGNQILAAPFSIIGSVGVLAQVPNFNRLLKKMDVDYNEYTAGEYKRTVSFLGEITDQGKQKFLDQLEETHVLFKEFIKINRPQVDVDQIATGEYWYGIKAKEKLLVDDLKTSDDYLMERSKDSQVYLIKYKTKKSFSEKLSKAFAHSLILFTEKIWSLIQQPKV